MNKRILIFTDSFPYGKSEPFLETELKIIVNSFERITILPIQTGEDREIRKIPEKVEVLDPVFSEIKNKKELIHKGLINTSPVWSLLGEGIRKGAWKSPSGFRIWFTHLLVIRSLISAIKLRNLSRLFNEHDILYFYWGLRWSQIIPFLSPDMNSGIVVRFHGSDLYEHTNKGFIPWRFQQLNRINSALAISETGRKYIEEQYPFMKDRIYLSRIGTIDYGINPYSGSGSLRIVSCSGMVAVKRIDLIVKTLGFLKVRVDWVHFGTGPLKKDIERLSAKLPENIKCTLAGALKHEDLMNYYRTTSIDLFINVSSSEGVPVSIMEAMSFGIPVIATDAGGTSEIVSEKTGLLIDKDFSPESLAYKIEVLINKPDLTTMRKAARSEWEKRSMADKIYPGFIDHLLSL